MILKLIHPRYDEWRMITSKLILIEGLPGSGKTTSASHLGTCLQQQDMACRWYLEEDDPHPIACGELRLMDLLRELPPLWTDFAEQASKENDITVIESRLWQNTVLFMFMDDYPLDEIVEVHQRVWKELGRLTPALIYLYQEDVERAMNRLFASRSSSALERDMETTSQYRWFQRRGLKGMAGWVQFFREWQEIAELLYSDWPYRKIKVPNPHEDWDQAHQRMYHFLQDSEASLSN